jgi:hypothetical protein
MSKKKRKIDTNISEEPTVSIFRVERGSEFFQNTGTYLPDYMASQPRRP